jgi:hypothetical protein
MTCRVHVGSGTVYLEGYVNVDVASPRCFLASERPDLVDRYRTFESDYYARHQDHATLDGFRKGPQSTEYVCDRFGRWDCIPCRDGEADEVLARSSFEHLSQTEAQIALREVRRVLTSGGLLRLSVPDHEASLKLLMEMREPIMVTHLLGPRNGPGGYHLQSYSRETLRAVIEAAGFEFITEEPNIHTSPAICTSWRVYP